MVVTPPAAAAMLAAGFAREHAHIDQAGRQHAAFAVDNLCA